MRETRHSIQLFIVLYIFWLLLNNSLAPDVLIVGAVAALLITLIFQSGRSVFSGLNLTPRGIVATLQFILYFLKELVKSNIRLAGIVLAPSLPLNPGIVKVRTRLTNPVGRVLLANAITMTPGTLTVELRHEWLYIHWVTVDATDVEGATADIVSRFERYLEVMYG